jgi:hypothetical protein
VLSNGSLSPTALSLSNGSLSLQRLSRQVFNMLDLDGGRSVDTEELHFGLHGAGHAISFEEVRAVRESR